MFGTTQEFQRPNFTNFQPLQGLLTPDYPACSPELYR